MPLNTGICVLRSLIGTPIHRVTRRTFVNFLGVNSKNAARLLCQVKKYPIVLTQEESQELAILTNTVDKFFAENCDPRKNDENGVVDPHLFEKMKGMGAFGMMAPEQLKGLGLTNTKTASIMEICGKHDLGVSVILGAHQSIGYKGIMLFGTEKQKNKYIPSLATGEKIACFCLTEPEIGSDAKSVKATAVYDHANSRWLLNGSKLWISNGDIADIFTVFASTISPISGEKGVTAFIVERGFGGVKHAPPEKKMGIKCTHSVELHFDNVPVPEGNVLGEVGKGFKIAVNILNSGRFGLGASMVGTMKQCYSVAYNHAVTRKQFGSELAKYEDIQMKLADMACMIYAAESIVYYVSGIMDMKWKNYEIESAVLKILSSEFAWAVCDETIQILGGMGYMQEGNVERVMRDLRIFRIFEGTNDILRQMIFLRGHSAVKADEKDNISEVLKPFGLSSLRWNNRFVISKQAPYFCLFGLAYIFRDVNQDSQIFARSIVDLMMQMFLTNVCEARIKSCPKETLELEELLFTHYKNMMRYRKGATVFGKGIRNIKDSSSEIMSKLRETDGVIQTTHPTMLLKRK